MGFFHLNGSNVLNKIRAVYDSLSMKEQTVADYILENPQETIHQTITELAENCHVAEATIFRLCKRVGFRGYQAFKIALASDIIQPIENIHEEIKATDNIGIIQRKLFKSHIDALNETLSLMEEEELQKAIDAISNADKVDFYGSGGSATIALDAFHKMIRTGIPCSYQQDSHLQIMSAALLTPKSVAVGISHSGSNKDVIDAIRVAKENGATTIGITGYMKSPLTKIVDILLYTSSKETKFRSESMASRIVQLAIVDTIFVGVSLKRQDETINSLQKIRQAISVKRF